MFKKVDFILQRILARARANTAPFTAFDRTGAKLLLADGGLMTRHQYDPSTGRHEYWFVWDDHELNPTKARSLKFKYEGERPINEPAAA